MVIERIGPLSAAKIIAALYAALGLAFGVVFMLIAVAGGFATAAFGADPSRIPSPALMLGLGAIFVFPIGYATIGFVTTLIGTSLYNVAASLVGGVEIQARETHDAVKR